MLRAMSQHQTPVQKARSALVDLCGSEHGLAAFEAAQKQTVEYWDFLVRRFAGAQEPVAAEEAGREGAGESPPVASPPHPSAKKAKMLGQPVSQTFSR